MKELKSVLNLLFAGSISVVAIVLCNNISATDNNWMHWAVAISATMWAIIWIRVYLKEE